MKIKIAVPDLQPGWAGGMRYLATIRAGLGDLEKEEIVEVSKFPRFTVNDGHNRRKYGVLNAITYSVDAIRGINALNIPRPMSGLSKRSLAWIPDLQDVERPDFFNSDEISRREKIRRNHLLNKRAFFFSSSHALEVFNSIGYEEPLIAGILRFATVFESQLHDESSESFCEGCDENGFFYLPNQWWIHKNHKWALDAFFEYQLLGGPAHLVLTGIEKDSRWNDYSADIFFSNLKVNNVHRLGMVKRSLQRKLYSTAIAVIQPSSYEGWSTTIEEALSLGAPIIASNIPTNIEQLFDCPDAVTIENGSLSALVQALMSPPKRLELSHIEARLSYRWKRFLNDLESTIILGERLTRENVVS